MKKFRIPVTWIQVADVIVEANSLEEAMEKVMQAPLPEKSEYLDGSFQIDEEILDSSEYYGELLW